MKKSYTTLNEEVTRIKTIMGIISEDKEILKELGEGSSKPYTWKNAGITNWGEKGGVGKEENYEFTTDSGVEYHMGINFDDEALDAIMSFGVSSINGEKYEKGLEGVVNRGEIYRVMATIMNIIKDWLSKHPKTRSFFFEAVQSYENDDRRLNLYYTYMKKNFPGSKIEKGSMMGGGEYDKEFTIEVTLPETEKSTNEEYCGKRPFYNCYQKAIDEWWNDDEAKNWIELFKKDGFDTALSTILKNSWDSLENQAELVADLTICYTKCESKLVQDAISKIGDLSVGDITGVNIAKNAISKIKNWWN